MTKKVRLGSLGLGWWGMVLAEGAAASGLAEVTTCFARTGASREAFADAHGCGAADSVESVLASDIDGVLIATPHSTHTDFIVQAAKAGKHVFVDKPMTLTAQDADLAIAATRAAGVVLQVGHNRRRQLPNRRIREMISAGELGVVQHLSATHCVPMLLKPDLPAWRRRPDELPAGGMTPLGVHQVDNFRYLGGPIRSVAAFSTKRLPGHDLDDTTTMVFGFESGALGHLYTSIASGPQVESAVHGTEATAWNRADGAELELQRTGEPDVVSIPIDPSDTVADELSEFARAIKGEATPETGGEEGRAVAAVLEAIVESAASGRIVEVNG